MKWNEMTLPTEHFFARYLLLEFFSSVSFLFEYFFFPSLNHLTVKH